MIPQGTFYAPQGTRYAPQGTRRTVAGGQQGTAPSWVNRTSNIAASIDLDFVNQRYWGGTPAAFITGTLTVTAGRGLVTSAAAGNKNGTGAAVAAFAGAWTCVIEMEDTAALGTQSCPLGFDGTDAPIFVLGFGGSVMTQARSFRTNAAGSIDTLDRFGPSVFKKVAVCRDGTGRSIAQNGTPATTSGTPHSVPSAVQWFRFFGDSNYFTGYIRRITIWQNLRASDSDLQTLSGPRITTTPYAGTGCIRGEYNQYVTFGDNTLNWEYTQPWTFCCAVKMDTTGDGSSASLASVVYTNVSATSVFPGHEIFFLSDLKPRVRLIHDISNSYIEVVGSTVFELGVWHFLAYTNMGTGLGSGLQIYTRKLGGPLSVETMTTVTDTLGGQSIVGGTQKLLFGNQWNRLGYNLMHFGDQACWYSDVKDVTWMNNYSTPNLLPPSSSDPKCEIWADFNEPSGTTVIDYSGKGRNGTLSASFMRVSG